MGSLRQENGRLEELVAETILEKRVPQKGRGGLRLGRGRGVRLGAAEKLEVIRLVESSELSVRRTLQELGVPRSTFYAWYRRYAEAGEVGFQGQFRDILECYNARERSRITYGGLVELIANAMVGIKEPFIKWEEHQTYVGEDS